MADEGLEDADQALRGLAFRQEIARQREDGDAGEHVVRREAVVFQRDGLDGEVVSPEEDEGGPAQGREDGSAEEGGQAEAEERGENPAFGRAGLPEGQADEKGSEEEGNDASGPAFGGVPDEADSDDPEADGEDELDDPDGDVVNEGFAEGFHGQDVLEAGQAEEKGDSSAEGGAEGAGCRFGSTVEECLQGRESEEAPVAGSNRAADHAGDEGEVLDDGAGAGDAGVEEVAEDDLGDGEEDHRGQGDDEEEILGLEQNTTPAGEVSQVVLGDELRSMDAAHFLPVSRWARYSFMRRWASSKASAGMT
jgi:hypothetical protein